MCATRVRHISSRTAWEQYAANKRNTQKYVHKMLFPGIFRLHTEFERQNNNSTHTKKCERTKASERTSERKKDRARTVFRVNTRFRVSCQINWYGFCLVPFCMRYPVCIFSLCLFFCSTPWYFASQSAAAFLFIIEKFRWTIEFFFWKKNETRHRWHQQQQFHLSLFALKSFKCNILRRDMQS